MNNIEYVDYHNNSIDCQSLDGIIINHHRTFSREIFQTWWKKSDDDDDHEEHFNHLNE